MTDLSALSDAELKALYAAPPAAAAKAPADMTDDELKAAYGGGGGVTAKDVGRVAGVAAQASAKSTIGGFGDLADLVGNGSEYLLSKGARALGANIPDRTYAQISEENKKLSEGSRILPRSDDVQRVLDKAGVGLKPGNRAERYADTIGGFATPAPFAGGGSNIIKGAKFVALPGAASEAVGEATKGTAAEPYARIGAAIAAPFAPGVGKRAVTPFPSSDMRRGFVQDLADEGVTSLTAGQRTGNKGLQYAESALGGGPAARIQAEGQQQFTEAAMRRTGAGPDASPDVLAANNRRLGNEFESLSARNTLQFDQQMANDVTNTVGRYGRLLDAQQRAHVGDVAQDIVDRLRQGNGTLPGTEYQAIRSDLSRAAQAATGNYATALRGLRDSLDDAMRRSIPQADREAWDTARVQLRAQKNVETAASRAGEAAAEGNITPANLRSAIATGKNRGAYARGQGDMAGLARAGVGVMTPLPNSGTGQREAIRTLATVIGGGVGGGVGGIPGAAVGAAGAAAAPYAMGRALMSGPGQSYLGNQLMPGQRAGSPTVAAIANALMASQQERR